MKYSLLKGFLAFSIAFSMIGLFLGGLAIASRPRVLEPALPQSSEAAGQLPGSQEVITETDRQALEELRSSPPGQVRQEPFPTWVQKILSGGQLQAASNHVTLSKSASTAIAPNGSQVAGGGTVTYTLRITNNQTTPISVTVLDVLPRDVQNVVQVGAPLSIQCGADLCDIIYEEKLIEYETSGGVQSFIIFTPDIVSWTITSLAGMSAKTMQFVVPVTCQPDGSILRNSAFFLLDDETGGSSNQVETVVVTPPDQSGKLVISANPPACSGTVEATNRLSAGDFEGDGDVDLAIGAVTGLTIFRNDGQGRFQELASPEEKVLTEDVLWADFDNDGLMEVLSVGKYDTGPTNRPNGTYGFSGPNYLYEYQNNSFELITSTFQPDYSFQANDALFRVAAGDYDNDGYLDLATSNYWGGCVLLLYRNRGPNFSVPFSETLGFPSPNLNCLIEDPSSSSSEKAVTSLAWGDYDNDGDQDLAAGQGHIPGGSVSPPYKISIYQNMANNLSAANILTLTTDLPNSIYDLSWGDYNKDGFLDLAAALRDGGIWIFQNNNGNTFSAPPVNPILPANSREGAAVDWADINRDGYVDLVVARSGSRPQIYSGAALRANNKTELLPSAPPPLLDSTVFGVQSFDVDNDGDLDLAMANRNGRSVIYALSSPHLSPTITPLPVDAALRANEVAWGDFDDNGYLDLAFGSGSDVFSRLYKNNNGIFATPEKLGSGPGVQGMAIGDVDDDQDLDLAISTSDRYQLHRNGGSSLTVDLNAPSGTPAAALAWADADDDGDLDLLAGKTDSLALLPYSGTELLPTPAWTTASADTRSVAWYDFNHDFFPDFAAGAYNGQTRFYRNNQGQGFILDSTLPISHKTTAVAWGDWDGDGQAELAVGNENERSYIYKQQGLTWTAVWSSSVTSATSSLAWGDWNNDGDLDLAVGNRGQPDQIYENLLAETGQAQLAWRWTSDEPTRLTTGVAWGDVDRDGDLDLAVSQAGNGNNGVYHNNYVTPSHLGNNFLQTMPLPNNPSYLSIPRAGNTPDGYFFSAAEILASPPISTVAISFRVFDPDGNRLSNNPLGDDITPLAQLPQNFEYSTNGGGTWQQATGTLIGGSNFTSRQGLNYLFRWNARLDNIVSDDVRFRVTLVNHLGSTNGDTIPNRRAGLIQRGGISAISPPFRVRALTCLWPVQPLINATPPYSPDVPIDFLGAIQTGSGSVTFTWNFGDGTTGIGQAIQHTYAANGTYTAIMTVTSQACPVARSLGVTLPVSVGTGVPDRLTYLPVIQKAGTVIPTAAEAPTLTNFELKVVPGAPGQVTGLSGVSQPGSATSLTWQSHPAADQILGYRLYRSDLDQGAFQRLAELPGTVTSFTETEASCNTVYFVTAFNQAGESLPSTASYFSLPCH